MEILLFCVKTVLGYSRKNPHTPDGWQEFLTPLPPRFPVPLDPCPRPDFQGQRPPSRLDFPDFFMGAKFNIQSIENTPNHIQKIMTVELNSIFILFFVV